MTLLGFWSLVSSGFSAFVATALIGRGDFTSAGICIFFTVVNFGTFIKESQK